ncbi:Dynamin-1 [Dactylella cylindrospora]|nr:Dynamin-1 [Dactylella cylindrospora]
MNTPTISFPEGPTSPATPANATVGSRTTSLHTTPALNDVEMTNSSNMSLSVHERDTTSVTPTTPVENLGVTMIHGSMNNRTIISRSSTMRKASSSMGYDMLGNDMRDMVNTINRLRMKGVEDLGLPLPRIAVIGNQSAGKSSLIEAISGIRVPRYAGTCTRCPLEITLTEDPFPNAPWQCKISLRFHKRYNRKSRGDPWVDMPHEQVHFLNLDDPDHVEPSLVRAQLAILNPSKQWGEYVDRPVDLCGSTTTEVPFSPNVICMEITGNGIPNLSFIDLPGIIQVTERREEEYLIKLVRNLVESYIKQEDCLILLAMTMKDDAVNQSAAQMARKLGPNRTIGALTKPDTVLDGEYDQWLRILRGQEHRLQPHGYFVTKQPSQQQLIGRISHPAARESEAEFFDTVEPWSSELLELKDRFGTPNLQKYLSKQLANLIRLRLPAIISNVQNQSDQVQAQLDRLPPPPAENLRQVLRQLLDEYIYQVRETVDSRGDNNEFSYQWRKIAEKLKNGLITLRPRVNPDETSPKPNNSPFSAHNAHGGIFGSFSSGSSSSSTPTKRKRPASADDPPDESSDPFNSPSAGPARKKIAGDQRTPIKKVISLDDDDVVETESIADTQGPLSKPMHLLEVREILEKHAKTHIPQTVDPKAVEIIAKMHIRFWEGPVQTFINQMDALLHDHVHNILSRIFARYEQSPLYAEMTSILDGFHEIMMSKIKHMVTKCLNIEAECVYTSQVAEWNREVLYWKEDNTKRRKRARDEQHALKVQRAQERHNAAGRKGKVEVPESDGPDQFQRELDTMTNAQAYCAIARKRFSDTVMMRMIRSAFTKYTIQGTFKEYIEQELRLRDMNEQEQERRCRELMLEDPQKERERNGLIAKKELLDNAWKDLEPFQSIGW